MNATNLIFALAGFSVGVMVMMLVFKIVYELVKEGERNRP